MPGILKFVVDLYCRHVETDGNDAIPVKTPLLQCVHETLLIGLSRRGWGGGSGGGE